MTSQIVFFPYMNTFIDHTSTRDLLTTVYETDHSFINMYFAS